MNTWQSLLYGIAALLPLVAFAIAVIFGRQLRRFNAYLRYRRSDCRSSSALLGLSTTSDSRLRGSAMPRAMLQPTAEVPLVNLAR